MIKRLHDVKTGEMFEVDEYQLRAYVHLACKPRSALFLGMGLAKTVITLSYILDSVLEGRFYKVLVIAPDKVARLTWKEEAEKWEHLERLKLRVIAGDANKRLQELNSYADVYTIGVDNIVWLIEQCKGELPFDCVVFDEMSLFKNRGSARFMAVRKAIKDVPYRHGLTGTPSPNGLIDLWSQMYLLDEGKTLFPNFKLFAERFYNTYIVNMQPKYELKAGANLEIARRVKSVALSMQTLDYVKLPEMIFKDVTITLDDEARNMYEELKREYVLDLLSGDVVQVSTATDLMNKLLQLSGGAVYDRERNVIPIHSAKIDKLVRLMSVKEDENFIIVYGFQHEKARILEALPYAVELPKGAKVQSVVEAWNRGEIRALVIHPASAGHGLNLQFGGSNMVWFSLTWSLEYWQQTIFRLLRRGQKNDVKIYRLIAGGTIDETVKKRINLKQSNQKFLLDAIENIKSEVR